MPSSGPTPVRKPRRLPPLLLVAVGVAGIEALVALGLAVLAGMSVQTRHLAMGVTSALFLLVYAGALAVCAYAVRSGRRWGRAPLVMAQFLTLGLAWNYRASPTAYLAAAGAVLAVVGLAGLLHPASMGELEESGRADGDSRR